MSTFSSSSHCFFAGSSVPLANNSQSRKGSILGFLTGRLTLVFLSIPDLGPCQPHTYWRGKHGLAQYAAWSCSKLLCSGIPHFVGDTVLWKIFRAPVIHVIFMASDHTRFHMISSCRLADGSWWYAAVPEGPLCIYISE